MKLFARVLTVTGALALALALLLMSKPAFAATTAANDAFVRVVHAAPAAPNVDVYVDGTKLLPGFAFGTVTGYVNLAAGSHTIAVSPAGQPESAAVIKGSATVTAGQYYTIAAIGNSTPAVTPALVVFTDDNTVTTGKSKVRVYHLSDNAGPVAVAAAPGATPAVASLAFQNASGYLTVNPGNYTFEVTLLSANNTKVTQAATLELHKITSVFAIGEVGGSGATAFKFVAKTENSVPSGLPQTGVEPTANSSTSSIPLWALIGGGVALALVLGGAGLTIARRRV